MTRLLPALLIGLLVLTACGIDGEPLIPPAKSSQSRAHN